MKRLPIIGQLLVFIALFILLWVVLSIQKPKAFIAPIQGGVIDCTDIDLERHVAKLEPDWDYYPDRLYAPTDFSTGLTQRPRTFQNGSDDAAHRYGTYRAVLRLPQDRPLAFYIYCTGHALRMYVDGEEVAHIGTVADRAEDFSPALVRRAISICPKSATTEIVLQYANFVHVRGGRLEGLAISSVHNIDKMLMSERASNLLLCGGLLTLAFYYFIVCLTLHKREILYFAACCLLLAARNEAFFYQLAPPAINWYTATRMLYILTALCLMTIVLLVHALYPDAVPPRLRTLALGLVAAFILCTIVMPTIFTTSLFPFIGALSLVALVQYVWSMRILWRSGDPADWLGVTGFLLLMIFSTFDLFWRSTLPLVGNAGLMPVGMLIFVVCDMLLLDMRAVQTAGELAIAQKKVDSLDKLGQMKSEFLANVSHELKTPLTVVSNYAQYTLDLLGDEDKQFHEMQHNQVNIVLEVDRMRRIVLQLLDTVAVESGRLKLEVRRTSLATIVQTIADNHFPMINSNNCTLHLHIEPNLPDIPIDRERITQVIINLLANAVAYTDQGEITIQAFRQGNHLTTSITDTGVGIPQELLDHVFQRYLKRTGWNGRGTGSGLGLYICKQIIDAHKGRITIQSEEGRGTTASFTLPMEQEYEG